jgi:hypothetical protein
MNQVVNIGEKTYQYRYFNSAYCTAIIIFLSPTIGVVSHGKAVVGHCRMNQFVSQDDDR